MTELAAAGAGAPDRPDRPHNAVMLALAGLLIGVLAGFTGMGGGFLMVPLLLTLGFESRRAVATSFVAILVITVSALSRHFYAGNVHMLVGGLLGLGGIFGAQIGARLVKRVSTRTFRRIFAVILLGIAIWLSITGWNELHTSTADTATAVSMDARLNDLPWLVWALAPIGIVVGVAGSFTGMGGGFLLVPILLGLGMPHTGSVGSSLFAVLLISLSALHVHWRNRAMHWRTGLLLGLGGLAGGATGGVLVGYVDRAIFKLIFALILLGISAHTARATRTRPS
ncbi:MAG: sulfite exporter TauE/SafE family protein [Planctomycetota bacterium]